MQNWEFRLPLPKFRSDERPDHCNACRSVSLWRMTLSCANAGLPLQSAAVVFPDTLSAPVWIQVCGCSLNHKVFLKPQNQECRS